MDKLACDICKPAPEKPKLSDDQIAKHDKELYDAVKELEMAETEPPNAAGEPLPPTASTNDKKNL